MNDIEFLSGSNFNEIINHPRIQSQNKTIFKDFNAISDRKVYEHLDYMKDIRI